MIDKISSNPLIYGDASLRKYPEIICGALMNDHCDLGLIDPALGANLYVVRAALYSKTSADVKRFFKSTLTPEVLALLSEDNWNPVCKTRF